MIMVTAYGREDVMRAARVQGIDSVLIKPVNASLLFDTLMQPLEHAPAAPRRVVATAPAAEQLPLAIRGASVLLVEDNELNQIVAVELLREAGFDVDVAENGEVAIERIERKDYDVVLMDMQMPVMDGETATRQLRSNPRHAHLPIVAMTANAMEADRQRCFAAGMNDHVAKPIEPAALWAALGRWIRPRPGLGATPAALVAVAGAADPAPTVVVPDIAGVDTALGLQRALGKPDLYAEMLRRFVRGQSGVLAELEQAARSGDMVLAERLAHTLRSVADNIGALDVSAQARTLEQTIRGGQGMGDAIDGLLAALGLALNPVLDQLQAWARTPQAPVPLASGGALGADGSAPQPQEPAQALQELCQLLEHDDPAACDFFQHNAVLLQSVLGSAFKAVKMHTLNFDFEQALSEIHAAPRTHDAAAYTPH